MAEYEDREHYIPIRKTDLLELLLRDPKMSGMGEDRDQLRRLHTLTVAVFHFEYLEQLEKLKDLYAPFDPDNETADLYPATPEKRERILGEFFDGVQHLLEKANFTRLGEEDVRAAMEGGATDWGINMDVDFNVFERYEIWVRGDTKGKRWKTHWLFRWMEVPREVDLYKRFVLVCKLKPHKRLGKGIDTESVYLKIFKDIPKLDLEMLMPGAKIQMPTFTKATMGSSVLGGAGYLLYSIWTTLWHGVSIIFASAVSALWLLVAPLGALFGFGFRQYFSYVSARQKYSLMLTESLYYQNLDNNAGVLTRLLDEAEEQEVREVILGYFFLWKYAPPEGWTEPVLDDFIEDYLEKKTKLKVDFEIGDSLGKLVRLKMVTQNGDKYQAVPIEKALEVLDYMWDNYFPYNQG
jgi:hypothetical protein